MASGPHTFKICTVFSPERYKGNPLAIVAVRGNAISDQRKSLIAKEFGYSETIFVHDAPGPGLPRKVDIFTEQGEEIPFGGHPLLGVAHYIFTFCERLTYDPQARDTQRQTAVFLTKAGPVPVFYNPYRQVAACSVPHNMHVHKDRLSFDRVLAKHPQIQIVPTVDKVKNKIFPVVSGVKGMTFALVDLTDAPEILGALKPTEAPELELDKGWAPSFVGCLYYIRKDSMEQENEPTINAIQARMISHGVEDPGTGSACSALACYLALDGKVEYVSTTAAAKTDDEQLAQTIGEVKLDEKPDTSKLERHVYAIQQGVEMGRLCTIAVEVDLKPGTGARKTIVNVTLSGRANFFASGELIGS